MDEHRNTSTQKQTNSKSNGTQKLACVMAEVFETPSGGAKKASKR